MEENKQTARKIRKREKIIDVAINMLETRKYNEIRIEDISAEFKMAKSMVFYYFESKAALYLAVLEKLHFIAIADFRSELQKFQIDNYNQLKNFIMCITHIFIVKHYLLIQLMRCEEQIYNEAVPKQIWETRKSIISAYDELLSDILQKTNLLTRNELYYVFEVQRHFLRGYHFQMIENTKYAHEKNTIDDRTFERKSLYEFRVLRMLRYFFEGIISEKMS